MGDRMHVLGGEKTFILSHLEVSEGEKQSPAKPPLHLQESGELVERSREVAA